MLSCINWTFLYHLIPIICLFFFFFNDTATTEIYTLSLHDALPISTPPRRRGRRGTPTPRSRRFDAPTRSTRPSPRASFTLRSEEHTSELQSPCNLVCRLLLEKKKKKKIHTTCRYK